MPPPRLPAGEGHPALFLITLGAVAHAFDQLHIGQAVLGRERGRELRGALRDVVRAAAGDREVVAADHDVAPVDLAHPHDERTRGEVAQILVGVVLVRANQRAGFEERAGIQELLDSFANRVAPARVLTRDPLGSAHLSGERLDVRDLIDGALPVLAGLPGFARLVNGHRVPLLVTVLSRESVSVYGHQRRPGATLRHEPIVAPRAISRGRWTTSRGSR